MHVLSRALGAPLRLIGLILSLPVRLYQMTLGEALPDSCRFTPSCSSYTIEALKVNGPFGLLQAVWRVLRCAPWSEGGHDPVKAIRPWNHLRVTRG